MSCVCFGVCGSDHECDVTLTDAKRIGFHDDLDVDLLGAVVGLVERGRSDRAARGRRGQQVHALRLAVLWR